MVFSLGFRISFLITMGLPVVFARAHAMALLSRQPTCL